jgi:hypothetical protein
MIRNDLHQAHKLGTIATAMKSQGQKRRRVGYNGPSQFLRPTPVPLAVGNDWLWAGRHRLDVLSVGAVGNCRVRAERRRSA